MNTRQALRILGLSGNANPKEITKSYKIKALDHHPDRTSGNEDTFKQLGQAYDYLKGRKPNGSQKRRRKKKTRRPRRKLKRKTLKPTCKHKKRRKKSKKTRTFKGGNHHAPPRLITPVEIIQLIQGNGNPEFQEFCGIVPQNNPDSFLLTNIGLRSSCLLCDDRIEQGCIEKYRRHSIAEWHAHTIKSKYYPSPEDILTVIKYPQIESRIYTNYGFWTIRGDGGVMARVRTADGTRVDQNRLKVFRAGGNNPIYERFSKQQRRQNREISRDQQTVYGKLNHAGDILYNSAASQSNNYGAHARVLNLQIPGATDALGNYIDAVNNIIREFGAGINFVPY